MYDYAIKLFGLERSGTNYLEWLIKNNCQRVRLLTNQLGWKHGVPSKGFCKLLDPSGLALLPEEESALYSHRSFNDTALTHNIRQIIAAKRLRVVIIVKNPYSWYLSIMRYYRWPQYPLQSAQFIRWSRVNRAYLKLQNNYPNYVALVRYEDLASNFETTITQIARCFGVSLNESLRDQPMRIEPGLRLSKM